MCTTHAKRVTLFDQDIILARRIRGDAFWSLHHSIFSTLILSFWLKFEFDFRFENPLNTEFNCIIKEFYILNKSIYFLKDMIF